MTIKEANALDMVHYLSSRGFEPAKRKGNNYWYLSPFRDETDPSFKVNRNRNQWYDFGLGKGGNLLDFILLLDGCSIPEVLQRLKQGNPLPITRTESISAEAPAIEILSVHEVSSPALIRYCQYRRITTDIAYQYLKEVRYKNGQKIYYALGFKNDMGGFELRAPYFKGSSHPKSPTIFNNNSAEVAVFEGFFDFLSYQTIHDKQWSPVRDFLVLNSTAFFEAQLPIMQEYRQAHLYMDNDKTGTKYTKLALAKSPGQFVDARTLYAGYKDLSDWHQHIGTMPNTGA